MAKELPKIGQYRREHIMFKERYMPKTRYKSTGDDTVKNLLDSLTWVYF